MKKEKVLQIAGSFRLHGQIPQGTRGRPPPPLKSFPEELGNAVFMPPCFSTEEDVEAKRDQVTIGPDL